MWRFVDVLLYGGMLFFFAGVLAKIPVLIFFGLILAGTSLWLFYSSGYPKASGNNPINTFYDKGNFGEFITFCEIQNLGFNHVFTNLYIPGKDDSTTEIDLVAIHKTGIYVFEIKNYSGWIFGDEYARNWTASLNRKVKNQFYNPIRQNFGHIESLKYFLNNSNENSYHSYIVFSIRSELKKINKKSSDDIICLTKQDLLRQTVKQHLDTRKVIYSEIEISNIRQILNSQCRQSKSMKAKHIENVKRKIKE
jgi:hypothetical protein